MNTQVHNLVNTFNSSIDKLSYFKSLDSKQRAMILFVISNKQRLNILNSLFDDEILDIFKHLDPDEITDIIQVLSKKREIKLLSKLNKNYKSKVDFLLKFAKDSAAGIMSLNYIIVNIFDTKKEISNRLEKHLALGKKEPTILVIDEFENFLGEIRISNLLFKKSEDLFDNLKELPIVRYNENQEEVIDIFRKNKLEKIVVLNEDNTIFGIIHPKDLFKVVEEENTEDFYGLAGLNKEEDINDNAKNKVRFRLKWLIVNLATAFLAAWVVTLFEETISKYVLLAAFMPIIAGMGGNAGTQTTAILIRSLALKKIGSNNIKKVLGFEILAAFLNGLVIGLIVGAITYFYNYDIKFSLIVSIAIILNMIIAAISGTLTPLILKSLNFDPASSSTVFVTTATDVLGFFILLGLARIFLF